MPEPVTREELAEAARAYRDLCACYRIGKRPTEKLFDRLSRANTTLSRLDAEQRPATVSVSLPDPYPREEPNGDGQ